MADWASLLGTLLLAIWTLRAVTQRSGGIALPLDDAFIHFCYARSFANLTPFVYSAGAAPSAGATSLLWPLVLAPFQAVLGTGTAMSWVAVAFGFLGLWGVCREARRLAEYFTDETLAIGIGFLPLTFGAHAWFAASGMEVMPLAWLLTFSCRRSLEFTGTIKQLRVLLLLAALCPLLRPEGALLSIWIAGVVGLRAPGSLRYFAGLALTAVALPMLVIWAFTGQLTPTTAVAKWLPLSPYWGGQALELTWRNVQLLFGTLLNGEGWTPMFLPTGYALISWLALAAVGVAVLQRRTRLAAGALLFVAAGMLLPASYETFLVNRLRYIWPFVTPWLIGLGLIAAAIGNVVKRVSPPVAASAAAALARYTVLATFAVGLSSKLPEAIADLADSSRAINEQQVSLAHWAKAELPEDALLGINDAGALTYFSARHTFDLVGLTTAGEAAHWRAGAGSRFEHYERLGAERLPTHFVIYPDWFQVDVLLGPVLQERYVESTILGGPLMRVHQADYHLLGSAALPAIVQQPEVAGLLHIVDELDVADLDSEHAHDYVVLPSSPADNRIFTADDQADGGRSNRTREQFRLRLATPCAIVMRLHSDVALELLLRVGNGPEVTFAIPSDAAWTEPLLRLAPELCGREQWLTVTSADGEPFSALHYWSIVP